MLENFFLTKGVKMETVIIILLVLLVIALLDAKHQEIQKRNYKEELKKYRR